MARGVNKAIIVGTLGKDPEVKYTAGGSAIANLTVATNESWKDKSTGENVEKPNGIVSLSSASWLKLPLST